MRAELGKFEGTNYKHVVQWLYNLAGDGFLDEELGECEGFGWYGKFSGTIKGRGPFHAICHESSQGFFSVTWINTEKRLNEVWSNIECDYVEFCGDEYEE